MKILTNVTFICLWMITFQIYWVQLLILLTMTYFLFAWIDILTGYYKNEKSERTSRKLWAWIAKRWIYLIIFLALTSLVWNIAAVTPDEHRFEICLSVIPICMISGFTLTELKSIIENIWWTKDPVPMAIIHLIDAVFELMFWRVSKIIQFMKNKTPQD